MTNIKAFLPALALIVCANSAHAQTALTMTTLSAAVTQTAPQIIVASATGITTAGSLLICDYGAGQCEFVSRVNAVSSSTIAVRRDKNPSAHASGAVVIIGPDRTSFFEYDPAGTGCATGANTWKYTPWININNGRQFICSTKQATAGVAVAGWGTNGIQPVATADVASVAGATLPSGPLFHVTGTNAITGWTLPVGFHGGSFKAVFDGAATWTAAGNIMLASLEAMTAGCMVEFTYENVAAKFYASTLTCAPTP